MAVGVLVVALVVRSVWDQQALMAWIGRASPIKFFTLMALLPALGVPITPFFVLAGATFGARIGVLGSLVALAANLTGCYWIARRIRPLVESLLKRYQYRLPEGARTNPTRTVVAVKLAPVVPAFVKSYALGLSGVPFGIYLGWSMLITGAWAVPLVVLGESLLQHDARRALWVVVALAALAMILWLRSREGGLRTASRE
jgi:uncharacterized membrane protein YdjX (TVP38/TMEM64 family)